MVESLLEIARPLLNSGAGVSAADDQGWTPIHAASRTGYREIVELLLESGAKLDVRTRKQETPLHLACGNGKLDVSHFLINHGLDINLGMTKAPFLYTRRQHMDILPLHSCW